jgi:hypothetical protein
MSLAALRNTSPRDKAIVEEQCHEVDKVATFGGSGDD